MNEWLFTLPVVIGSTTDNCVFIGAQVTLIVIDIRIYDLAPMYIQQFCLIMLCA